MCRVVRQHHPRRRRPQQPLRPRAALSSLPVELPRRVAAVWLAFRMFYPLQRVAVAVAASAA